jgi:hypothetical protein
MSAGTFTFVDLIYGAAKLDRRVEAVEDLLREWRVREADWGQLYLEFKRQRRSTCWLSKTWR